MSYGLIDVYVLAPKRAPEAVFQLLEAVMPNHVSAQAEFVIDDHASGLTTFESAREAVEFSARNECVEVRFYFQNKEQTEPRNGMAFFTRDGGLILGISISGSGLDLHREEHELCNWLERLGSLTGAKLGYALLESPPPCDTIGEFVNHATTSCLPMLLDGKLVRPKPGQYYGPLLIR